MSMNVNELALRLHLRAMARRSRVDPTFGGVSFGGSCCDECQEKGTSCGGDKSAPCCAECARTGAGTVAKPCNACSVSFGAVPQAPPPPQMNAPYSGDQLVAYAKYVDDRAQALARTYSTLWMDPRATWWVNGDICNSKSPSYNSDQATQILLGSPPTSDPGFADYVIQNCQPDFWKNKQQADNWATQVPRGGWAGWITAWNSYYANMQANLSVSGFFTGSVFDEIQQFHKELIWMSNLANQMKLPLVPDPGPLVVAKGIGEQIGGGLGKGTTDAVSGFLSEAGGLILLAGGVYLGVKLLTEKRR